jgi:pantoate--beta-alanine ligase
MTLARTVAELRAALAHHDAHRAGPGGPRRRAFVPTMGALHVGHVALVDAARRDGAFVVASIFVNPRQFEDQADLAAYPRPEAEDIAIARRAGVDLLFLPSEPEMYPEGDATVVDVGGPAEGYEGEARPGHFRGVATVCLKLFHLVQPDVAYFGQKDAQQVAVIRRLVRDTHLSLEIRVAPTVRGEDGVAWSSRNVRLSAREREAAAAIPRALRAAVSAHDRRSDPVAAARRALDGLDVEYVDVAPFAGDPTLVLAVRIGGTRLIDNVPLLDPARAGL